MTPRAMEKGSAGSAFWKTARHNSVRPRPAMMAR